MSETSNSNVSVVADKSVDNNDNEDRKSEEVNSKKSKKLLFLFTLEKTH